MNIPDDPTEADVLAVLAALHLGTKVEWDTSYRGGMAIKHSTFVTCLRWVDGFVPRHWRHVRSVPEVIIYQTRSPVFRS